MSSDRNYKYITVGLKSMSDPLSKYIAARLRAVYGSFWWQEGVLNKLKDDSRRGLPKKGADRELADSLDAQRCLLLLVLNWKEAFRTKLPQDCRSYAHELLSIRNRWAHAGRNEFDYDDIWRALDTIRLLCKPIDPDFSLKVQNMKVKYSSGLSEGEGMTEMLGYLKKTDDGIFGKIRSLFRSTL